MKGGNAPSGRSIEERPRVVRLTLDSWKELDMKTLRGVNGQIDDLELADDVAELLGMAADERSAVSAEIRKVAKQLLANVTNSADSEHSVFSFPRLDDNTSAKISENLFSALERLLGDTRANYLWVQLEQAAYSSYVLRGFGKLELIVSFVSRKEGETENVYYHESLVDSTGKVIVSREQGTNKGLPPRYESIFVFR
jgi:hypothetical protein